MPLVFSEEKEEYLWGIWKIEEQEKELMNDLPPEVFQELMNVSSMSKRVQILAGRRLLKELCHLKGIDYLGVIKNNDGKPYLYNQEFHISISHAEKYAVAIIHFKINVGIDIEVIQEKLNKVKTKFLSVEELTRTGIDLKKLCIYWSVKECVYKINGCKTISLKNDIRIEDAQIDKNGGVLKSFIQKSHHPEIFKIRYIYFNDHYIAFNI